MSETDDTIDTDNRREYEKATTSPAGGGLGETIVDGEIVVADAEGNPVEVEVVEDDEVEEVD